MRIRRAAIAWLALALGLCGGPLTPALAQTQIPASKVKIDALAKTLEQAAAAGQIPQPCTIAAGALRVFTEGGTCGQAVNGALVSLTDAANKSDCGPSGNPPGTAGGGTVPNVCQYRSSTAKLEPFGGAGGAGDVTGGSASTAGELAAYSSTSGKALGRTSGQAIGGGATPGMAHAVFYDSAIGRWVSRSLFDTAVYVGGNFAHAQIADLFSAMLGGPEALCATGFVRGGGYDAPALRFLWTCGNYPWSASFGGRVAGVANYATATTAGGNTEIATCTGNGSATTAAVPGGYSESACYEAGQIVHKNATADLMLAHDFTQLGGKIYVPAGTYELAGCGARSDGTPNSCPVLRYPENGHLQRELQAYGGRKFVGAGMDGDGPYEPVGGKLITGSYLVVNRGIVGSVDGDGTGAVLNFWGQQVGVSAGEGTFCSATAPSTDCVVGINFKTSVSDNAWAGVATILAASVPPGDNTDLVCVDNQESTTGTCSVDRHRPCTTDANCSAFSPSQGTCDGFVDAMEYEVRTQHRAMIATFVSPTCNDSESSCVTGSSGFLAPVNQSLMPLWACGPSSFGKWMQFGTSTSTGGVSSFVESQKIPINGQVYATDMGKVMNEGGGIEGFTFIHASPKGRIAGDSKASGTATTGSGSTTLVTAAGGMTTNAHSNRTLVLAAGTKKQQARKIVSNTASTFTVTPAWTETGPAFDGDPMLDLPLTGETWRVSSASCTTNEPACDIGIVVGMQAGIKGGFYRNAIWYADSSGTFTIDGSLVGHKIEIADNLIANMVDGKGTDASDWTFKRNVWLNNTCSGGGTLLNLGFVGGSNLEDEFLIGNSCHLAENSAMGGTLVMKRIHAVGNSGTVLVVSSRHAGVYSDFLVIGQKGAVVKITPHTDSEVIGSSSFKGFRVFGTPNQSPDGQFARAIISIGSLQGTRLGRLKNILFEDWQVRSTAGEYNCFAALDYDRNKYTGAATSGSTTQLVDNTSTPWPSGGANGLILYIRPGTATQEIRTIFSSTGSTLTWTGQAALTNAVAASDAYAIHEPISEDFGQVTFRDIGMEEIGSATKVAKMICAMDLGDFVQAKPDGCSGGAGPTECNSDDDRGIWNTVVQPIMENVKLNGVAIANQTSPPIFASQAPTCSLTPNTSAKVGPGAQVRIRDDPTIGGCLQVDGVLSGGGSFSTSCVCRNFAGVAAWGTW